MNSNNWTNLYPNQNIQHRIPRTNFKQFAGICTRSIPSVSPLTSLIEITHSSIPRESELVFNKMPSAAASKPLHQKAYFNRVGGGANASQLFNYALNSLFQNVNTIKLKSVFGVLHNYRSHPWQTRTLRWKLGNVQRGWAWETEFMIEILLHSSLEIRSK